MAAYQVPQSSTITSWFGHQEALAYAERFSGGGSTTIRL